ncbi:MAG TPA: hypothetical protein VGI54_04220, partial [Solirubrobacteraceae bacterium]
MPRQPDRPPQARRALITAAGLCALTSVVLSGGPVTAGTAVAGTAGGQAGTTLPVRLTILNVSPSYLTAKGPVV